MPSGAFWASKGCQQTRESPKSLPRGSREALSHNRRIGMSNYRVTWTIDVEMASSPREAAERARTIQLDPCSTATVFEVQRVSPVGKRSNIGPPKTIDLEPAKEEFLANGHGECIKCGAKIAVEIPVDCPDCGARHV